MLFVVRAIFNLGPAYEAEPVVESGKDDEVSVTGDNRLRDVGKLLFFGPVM